MAALTDLSDLINRQSGGHGGNPNNLFFHKFPRVAGVAATAPIAGRGCSLWTYDGTPASGAVPGAAAIPTRATAGALPFVAPSGGRDLHLIGASLTPITAGVYLLYDRLMHCGGLSGTVTTAQTVQGASPGTPPITRNTGGAGNMAWYEIYTAIGTSAPTLTMTYTDQDGNAATSTINIGATGFREVTRAQRIPLAAGDTGIRSIQSVQLTATTGTAGNFGITLAKPLAWLPVSTGGAAGWRDYTTGLPGIPTIDPDACLALMFIPAVAAAPELWGCFATVEK